MIISGTKQKDALSILFFIIWPFGSFIYSVCNFRKDISKVIYVLFHIYLGFNFVISTTNDGADSYRYALDFLEIAQFEWDYLGTIFIQYFSKIIPDIYFNLTSFCVSRFTSDPSYVFALWGGVYGYFSMRCLDICIKRIKSTSTVSKLPIYFLFATFSFISLVEINRLRFSTGMYVFVYASCQIVLNKKNIYWILAFSSFLIHYMYGLACMGLILAFFIKDRLLPAYIIFILSLVYVNIFQSFFYSGEISLGEVFDQRISCYSNEDYNLSEMDAYANRRLILSIEAISFQIYVYFVLLITQISIFLNRKKYDNSYIRFSVFLIIMASIVNLLSDNFHAHFRYETIMQFICLIYLFIFVLYNFQKKISTILFYFSLLPISLQLIVMLRQSFEYLDSMTFISNFPASVFIKSEIPFIDLIK